jgi:dipeptidyl-peptidase-4
VATSSPWKYHNLQLQGWTIHVEDKLFEQKELKEDVLALLRNELWEIRTRLPQAVVQRLQKVKMRFHLNRTECPGGVYHPSPVWLSEHGLPPDWAEGIEFGVAKNFLTWSRTQPDMVLHELSHAWHHQVLGYEHEGIRKAFDAAVKSGSLERVPYVHGGERRAYARNNPQEFFAEMSEAWWGVNDFYPFVHAEVLASFPEVGNLMDQVWALPQ